MIRAHECFHCGHRCECEPGNRGGDCDGCGRCGRRAFADSWLGVIVGSILILAAMLGAAYFLHAVWP